MILHDIFEMLKEKKFTKNSTLVEIFFKYVGEINTFLDKEKLKDFINTRPPYKKL